MVNILKEIEILRNIKKEILQVKVIVNEIKHAFHELIGRLNDISADLKQKTEDIKLKKKYIQGIMTATRGIHPAESQLIFLKK